MKTFTIESDKTNNRKYARDPSTFHPQGKQIK